MVADPTGITAEHEPEARHPRVAQLRHRPGGDPASAGQHDQAVAQALDEVELVAGEEHRDAVAGVFPQQVDHRVDGQRVEPGEGLVEDQRGRPGQHRGDDLHPLLVAERELLEVVLGALAEPEPLEQLLHLRRGPRRVPCP